MSTVGAPASSSFTPFRQGLSYQPVQLTPMFSVPQKDYVADITAKQQLDDFFNRNLGNSSSLFEGKI